VFGIASESVTEHSCTGPPLIPTNVIPATKPLPLQAGQLEFKKMDLIMHSHLGKSAPNVFHEPSFSDLERGACDRTTAKNDLDTIPGKGLKSFSCHLGDRKKFKRERSRTKVVHEKESRQQGRPRKNAQQASRTQQDCCSASFVHPNHYHQENVQEDAIRYV